MPSIYAKFTNLGPF